MIKPYAALLGRGLTPRLPAARRTLTELTYDGGTAMRVRRELDNPAVLAGDMRPFVWRSGVYLSHWVLRNNTPSVEGNALQACTQSAARSISTAGLIANQALHQSRRVSAAASLCYAKTVDHFQQRRLVVTQERLYALKQCSPPALKQHTQRSIIPSSCGRRLARLHI